MTVVAFILIFIIVYLFLTSVLEEAFKNSIDRHTEIVWEKVKEERLIPKVNMIWRNGYIAGKLRERKDQEELRKGMKENDEEEH